MAFKRSRPICRDLGADGRVYPGLHTRSASFFTANNEPLRGIRTERKSETQQRGLERIPHSAMGWQLSAWVSWLPRLEASHTICFSHQWERACPRPLICFSHDLHLWVFLLSVFLMDTKRFFALLSPSDGLTLSYGQQEIPNICQFLWVSPLSLLGMIPRLVWKIMSHLVRLASSVKTPSSTLPKQKKWLGSHLCFGTFLWVIVGRLRLRERDVG